jgi:hypothetical protein
MKKTITILLLTSIISFTGISQTTQVEKDAIAKHNTDVIDGVIKDLLSDEELNRPYEVIANHGDFRGRGMDIVKNNQDSILIKISQLPRFSGALIVQEDGSVNETTDISLIAKTIDDLQSQITSSVSSSPSKIWESDFLGDSTHIEWWYFKNKKGEDSKFGVTFTNGQITVLYFKI